MPSEVAQHSTDRIDRAIVSRLQVDGRLPNVDLAEAVALSPSACLRRVKALEASGIIAGYRAEVDRVRAGLGLTVFIELKVGGHSRETSAQLEAALTRSTSARYPLIRPLLSRALTRRRHADGDSETASARSTLAIRPSACSRVTMARSMRS